MTIGTSTLVRSLVVLSTLAVSTAAWPARGAVLGAATVGCSSPADATRLVALQGRGAAQTAAAQPLEASRACLPFAKGLAVDIDESRPPLTCIRLPGDLSCYWVSSKLIDEHPGEKGGGGKRGGGGGRRH